MRKTTKGLSPATRRTIALNFNRGIPPKKIAEKVGVDVHTVENYIKENHGAKAN